MLWLQNNQLTSIDLSKNTQIKDLWLTGNRITSIDLLGNIKAKPLLNNNCIVKVSFVYNNNMRWGDSIWSPADVNLSNQKSTHC